MAVIRRGPTDWVHLGRWDVERGAYESGSWMRARLFPQRSDVSPDGRYFVAFAYGGRGTTWLGTDSYILLSRLPWFHALAAWRYGGTYGSGFRFTTPGENALGDPDEGDVAPLLGRFGLVATNGLYACERARGWIPDNDAVTRFTKSSPASSSDARLVLAGAYAARRIGSESDDVEYGIEREGDVIPLPDVQWADWDASGRLLAATRAGALQIRDPDVLWEHDLAAMTPDPQPPPPEASAW